MVFLNSFASCIQLPGSQEVELTLCLLKQALYCHEFGINGFLSDRDRAGQFLWDHGRTFVTCLGLAS